MNKEKNNNKKSQTDYQKAYKEIFELTGVNSKNLVHEWEKEGDVIKEYSLYDETPTPIMTPNTHSI